ncbi:hypothetical protein EXU85_20465 [Spirosoma sp. KCTC 42546]|uniref:hypothetical protein n=1 Tax=Spirosoma sp. KCTC 42546 TaxID=2520506 RepID=UPI001159FEBF|nr:hypothetical protein [Spirosoma sp. KCTC 42546]QDK80854.1 hypothetical protein EXU85_20465 [Spirosoma sp. KCTC 42546]
MLTWKERYAKMKKYYGWTDSDVAFMIGNTPKSVNMVVNSEQFPRWLKLAIIVHELEQKTKGNL